MATALTYGKRCLKAVLDRNHQEKKKRKPLTPEEETIYWCEAGLDKDGFTVKYISDFKGFGVFASEEHKKGDFLLEYVGEHLTVEEAEEREKKHQENKMFTFTYKGKQQCIDASATQGHICQLINDGDKHEANCIMKLKVIRDMPRLCLYALKDLQIGEELLYDYGDETRNLWWRKKDDEHDWQNYTDHDEDDDPFDIGKISDISSDEEIMSGSSLSEIIPSIIPFGTGRKKAQDEPIEQDKHEKVPEEHKKSHGKSEKASEGCEESQAEPETLKQSLSENGKALEESDKKHTEPLILETGTPTPKTSQLMTKKKQKAQDEPIEQDKHEKVPEEHKKSHGKSEKASEGCEESQAEPETLKQSLSENGKALEESDKKHTEPLILETGTPTPKTSQLMTKKKQKAQDEPIEQDKHEKVPEEHKKSHGKSEKASEGCEESQAEPETLKQSLSENGKALEESDKKHTEPLILETGTPTPKTSQLMTKKKQKAQDEPIEQDKHEKVPEEHKKSHGKSEKASEGCEESQAEPETLKQSLSENGKALEESDKKHTEPLILETGTPTPKTSQLITKKKQRPGRMCCFCEKVIEGGKLKRHLFTHKKTHDEVAAIFKTTVQDRNKWVDQKRIEGMYLYNISHIDLDESELMRERKPKILDSLRMCLGCKRFFSNRTYYKHKEKCEDNTEAIKTQSLQPLNIHKDSDFVVDILNKFRDGDVGRFIRENKIVQVIGYKHFLSRKAEDSKINEVRKEVMMEMRELTRLFLCFASLSELDVTFEDMYKRDHLSTVKEAMNKLCKSEVGEKSGLKVNCNSIFQRSIKILSGYYAQCGLDAEMKEVKKFKEAYKFNLPEIISKARYITEKNSLKKARQPKNLPIEEDMTKLKRYITTETNRIVVNFKISEYTSLRSLVVARLTLYNARRGEEGSRLLLEEWLEAVNGTWVPKESIEQIQDDAEKFLVGKYRLAYMAGKGRKCVPVLIPVDLLEAVQLLISNRGPFGIDATNPFLFATKSSKLHCSGWHAVAGVCKEAGVSVTATKNRHRASTVYTSLDMKESDRKIFFEHLGHEENISKENYQCPPGLAEIRVMGPFLDALEDGIESTKKQAIKKQKEEPESSEIEDFVPESDCDVPMPDESFIDVPDNSSIHVPEDSETANTAERKKKTTVSFRWSNETTSKIKEDFKEWIQKKTGSRLPCKKVLQDYHRENNLDCTLMQLRTKIMNEQNKFKNLCAAKLLQLQG